jgi:hypothetical protein
LLPGTAALVILVLLPLLSLLALLLAGLLAGFLLLLMFLLLLVFLARLVVLVGHTFLRGWVLSQPNARTGSAHLQFRWFQGFLGAFSDICAKKWRACFRGCNMVQTN